MLLDSLLVEPQLWVEHIRRYSHSIMTQVLFGFRTESMHDPKRDALYHVVENLSELIGSSAGAILEVYPLARRLPDFLLPAKSLAKRLHKRELSLFGGLWLDAKNNVLEGDHKASQPLTLISRHLEVLVGRSRSSLTSSQPSFAADLVQSQRIHGMSDSLCGYTLGSLLEAGSDTSANTLIGLIQAMILFPSAQEQAQVELDRVCGDARLPSTDDIDHLPYIRACVKEALRWMPTAILGVPHRVMQDDEYMGYRIPGGASVVCNVWAIHMDENRHPHPRDSDPSRYIDDHTTSYESASAADAKARDHFGFGAGRRICQGMHIADRTLLFAVARLLWAFDIRKGLNEEGEEVVPDPEKLTAGFVVQPQRFPARITPRSQRHAAVLQRDWEASQGLLDKGKQWKHAP